MKIALFRGTGFLSGAIEDFSRSVYSHAAVWWPELSELHEAVADGFVCVAGPEVNHDKGTVIDVLSFKEPLSWNEDATALDLARKMSGPPPAPYNYEMCFAGFPLRLEYEPAKDRRSFFCSEAVFLICAAMGPKRVLLERTQAWKVPPEGINLSPLLLWENSLVL